MANRWGLNEVFGYNLEGNRLFHGSPCRIVDQYIATGTYFTPDATIAMQYGAFIYSIEVDELLLPMFCPDSLKEHLVNHNLIPLYMFHVDDTTFQGDDEELFF